MEWLKLGKLFERLAFRQSGDVEGHVSMRWRNASMVDIQGTLLSLAGASWTMKGDVLVLNVPAKLPAAPQSDRFKWQTLCPDQMDYNRSLSCVPVSDLEVVAVSTAEKIPSALIRRRTRGLGYGIFQYVQKGNYVGQIPLDTYMKLSGRIYPFGIVQQVDGDGVDSALKWVNQVFA